MEKGELLGEGLFDEPAASISAEDGGEAGFEVISEEQDRTPAGAAQDGDLADFGAEAAQGDGLVVGRDEAGAAGGMNADAA